MTLHKNMQITTFHDVRQGVEHLLHRSTAASGRVFEGVQFEYFYLILLHFLHIHKYEQSLSYVRQYVWIKNRYSFFNLSL